MTGYTHTLDLAKEAEPPANGILSRTVFQDGRLKAVVFGFGQGSKFLVLRRATQWASLTDSN
jgi:hypothetical protein